MKADQLKKTSEDGTLNWGVLPVLKDGDQWIEQSNNILEYIATKADAEKRGAKGNKYTGADGELPHIRSIAHACYDFQMKGQCWKGKAEAPAGFVEKDVPHFFGQIVKVLDKNDDGDVSTEEWSFGKNFTFADVAIFDAVNAVVNIHGTGKTLRPFPKLKAFHDKIAARGGIERHLSTRPDGQ